MGDRPDADSGVGYDGRSAVSCLVGRRSLARRQGIVVREEEVMDDDKIQYYALICTMEDLHLLRDALARDIATRSRDGKWLCLNHLVTLCDVHMAYPRGMDVVAELERILRT